MESQLLFLEKLWSVMSDEDRALAVGKILETLEAPEDSLDELVIELKLSEASHINNTGREEQLDYIFSEPTQFEWVMNQIIEPLLRES